MKKTGSPGRKEITRRSFLKTSGMLAAGVSAGGVLGAPFVKNVWAQSPSGTINVVMKGDADSYDPHLQISDDGKMISAHVNEALLSMDMEPQLATSWEVPDPNTWIFHLKKGVEFTNGEAFDASVVKFNLERYHDPATNAPRRAMLDPVSKIETVDKHTVKIETKSPYAILDWVVRDISMMSPAAVKEYGNQIAQKPVGTGPFLLKEWVPSERTVLEANPDYYGTKPKVQNIIWRPVSEASTRIVELKSGRADLIDKVPNELIGEISGEGLRVIRIPSLWRHSIFLNCGAAPFDNVKVRRALGHAINMDEIVKYVLRGAGSVIADPAEGWPSFDPSIKPRTHDIAKAKRLLAEAGYPNGIECKIVTPAGRYLKDKEVMEAISYQVKAAGINMKVIPYEWGMFLKKFKSEDGFFVGGSSPPHFLYGPGYDSRTDHILWFGYRSEAYNMLLTEQEGTFERDARKVVLNKLSRKLLEDVPSLYLFLAQNIFGVSDRITGFTPRPDGWIFLHNAAVV